MSKSKQTNKQTQFKISDDHVKRETTCNVIFLKRKINFIHRIIILTSLVGSRVGSSTSFHRVTIRAIYFYTIKYETPCMSFIG